MASSANPPLSDRRSRSRHQPEPTIRTFVGAARVVADWVTAMLCPATVMVVVRGAVAVLAVAPIVTNPLPLPVLPLVMLNQDDDRDDVQAHVPVVVTEMVALPAAAPIDRPTGATVKLHVAAS
jgi:hypothetical protein